MYWITYVKFGLIGVLSIGLFSAGWYVNGSRWEAKYNTYRNGIETAAKEQEVKTHAIVKEQQRINDSTKETYEAKLSAIKSFYGGMRKQTSTASSCNLPSIPNAPKGADESPRDLILTCANTTQQLISLQDWIKKQQGAQDGD